MNDIIEIIRAAVAPEATPDARGAGVEACRTILAALSAKQGEPMTAAVAEPASPIAAIVGGLRTMPPDQLLDLAIAKLRAALPADTQVPPAMPLKFHLIPTFHRG
jgi:hypothetical protein